MNLSHIIAGAFQKADNSFEIYFEPGGNPNPPKKQFNYLGLMTRMSSHIKKHPNSGIRNFPLILEQQSGQKTKQKKEKITKSDLEEAVKMIEENGCNFRLDNERGILAAQNKEGEVEVLFFDF
jgi:hypothetical protein